MYPLTALFSDVLPQEPLLCPGWDIFLTGLKNSLLSSVEDTLNTPLLEFQEPSPVLGSLYLPYPLTGTVFIGQAGPSDLTLELPPLQPPDLPK